MNHFDESESVPDFKKTLEDLRKKMAKADLNVSEVDISSWDKLPHYQANGARLPKPRPNWRGWHQTAQGVSTAIALAVKLGTDPWEVIEK